MRGNAALGALAASWGFIAVLVASVELGAGALAFWRLAFAAATLLLVALVTGRLGLLAPGERLGALVLLGIVQCPDVSRAGRRGCFSPGRSSRNDPARRPSSAARSPSERASWWCSSSLPSGVSRTHRSG